MTNVPAKYEVLERLGRIEAQLVNIRELVNAIALVQEEFVRRLAEAADADWSGERVPKVH